MSIIYIDRFCEINNYILCMNNIHRILLTACLLSIKFNEDIIETKDYAKIAGIPTNDLNFLEFYFCVKIKFSFFVDYDIYDKYYEYFLKSYYSNLAKQKEKKIEKET